MKTPKAFFAKLKDKKEDIISLYAILGIIAAVVILAVIWLISDIGGSDIGVKYDSKLVISEVMSKNRTTYCDDDGIYCDWIEIHNVSDETVSLEGYYLSDDVTKLNKWEFPPLRLSAGEYLIVLASGEDKFDSAKGEYHTNFKISSSGEDIYLSGANGTEISSISVSASPADVSYGIVKGEGGEVSYKWFSAPTPGRKNDGEYADTPFNFPSQITGIVINEYMTDNSYTIYDSEGDYSDWVELRNTTDSDIDLSGCALTEVESITDRWIFPEGSVIAANGYMLIYLSGKDKIENGEIHTSFKIGELDTEIVLYDKTERVIDRVELEPLGENISFGLTENGEPRYYSLPTPGEANGSGGFETKPINALTAGQIFISEVCAAGVDSYTGRPLSDWIELYNPTDTDISLDGYSLSNSLESLGIYKLGGNIPAKGHYVIKAVGRGASASDVGAPFKISSSGETLYLCDKRGRVIDRFQSGKLRIGVTSGRSYDGSSGRCFFNQPTMGGKNSSGCTAYAPKPEILTSGGYAKVGQLIEISVPDGTCVRYTLDGSEPNEQSSEYTAPIEITQSVTLKACAFAEGLIRSDTVFATYITEEKHSVPVLCLSGDDYGLFGEPSGILYHNVPEGSTRPYISENFWQDWEREVSVEYYSDGKKQFSLLGGLKVFGQTSRDYRQKSLVLHLRDLYGASSVTYPFFDGNEHTTFKSLVMRAGGQDQSYTRFRDEFCARVIRENSSNVLAADYQPIALYINGNYWGLFSLREKINEEFLEQYFGIDEDNVDIIKQNGYVLAGDDVEYKKLLEFMNTHSMEKDENYKQVCAQVDIDSSIDYVIFETFFRNWDKYNIRVYRERTAEGKWRWIVYDMDITMRTGADNAANSMMGEILHADKIISHLLKNDSYKERLLDRYSQLLKTAFAPNYLTSVIEDMEAEIDAEIERNNLRWNHLSYSDWQSKLTVLKSMAEVRRDVVVEELTFYFSIDKKTQEKLFSF